MSLEGRETSAPAIEPLPLRVKDKHSATQLHKAILANLPRNPKNANQYLDVSLGQYFTWSPNDKNVPLHIVVKQWTLKYWIRNGIYSRTEEAIDTPCAKFGATLQAGAEKVEAQLAAGIPKWAGDRETVEWKLRECHSLFVYKIRYQIGQALENMRKISFRADQPGGALMRADGLPVTGRGRKGLADQGWVIRPGQEDWVKEERVVNGKILNNDQWYDYTHSNKRPEILAPSVTANLPLMTAEEQLNFTRVFVQGLVGGQGQLHPNWESDWLAKWNENERKRLLIDHPEVDPTIIGNDIALDALMMAEENNESFQDRRDASKQRFTEEKQRYEEDRAREVLPEVLAIIQNAYDATFGPRRALSSLNQLQREPSPTASTLSEGSHLKQANTVPDRRGRPALSNAESYASETESILSQEISPWRNSTRRRRSASDSDYLSESPTKKARTSRSSRIRRRPPYYDADHSPVRNLPDLEEEYESGDVRESVESGKRKGLNVSQQSKLPSLIQTLSQARLFLGF